MKRWILLVLLPVSLFAQNAQDLLNAPAPKQLVSDYSDILSPKEEAYLENLLLDYADTTSTQIAVVTVETTGGDNINLITAEIAANWEIGQQGKDNGCLILVASGDREISIQNGYGLEPYLTDFTSKQIIENDILPEFKGGSYFKGLVAGSNAIMQVLDGTYEGKGGRSIGNRSRKKNFGKLLIIILVLIMHYILNSRGGGGSGGYRTGTFIGGTRSGYTMGRSGGFTSNGSFGGFGGGGFGGGGASGGW
ncbi:MAG: TPM domain-containing protein [Schleiferiaceae bacterium]